MANTIFEKQKVTFTTYLSKTRKYAVPFWESLNVLSTRVQ